MKIFSSHLTILSEACGVSPKCYCDFISESKFCFLFCGLDHLQVNVVSGSSSMFGEHLHLLTGLRRNSFPLPLHITAVFLATVC